MDGDFGCSHFFQGGATCVSLLPERVITSALRSMHLRDRVLHAPASLPAESRLGARGSAVFQFSVSTADGSRLNPEAFEPEAVLVESAGGCNLLPRKIVNGSFSPRPRSRQPGEE